MTALPSLFIYYLVPVISLLIGAISLLAMIGSRGKGRSIALVFGIAAAAYFLAIFLKEISDALFSGFFLKPNIEGYIAVGAQTVFFEIGLAFLFALIFKKYLDSQSAIAMGSGLAMCENFVLLGIFGIISMTLTIEFNSAALPLKSSVISTYISDLLPHILDRISSLIGHTVWGFLAVMFVFKKSWRYLIAFPVGFLDSFAIYFDEAHPAYLSYLSFSLIILAVSILWAYAALKFTKNIRPFSDQVRYILKKFSRKTANMEAI